MLETAPPSTVSAIPGPCSHGPRSHHPHTPPFHSPADLLAPEQHGELPPVGGLLVAAAQRDARVLFDQLAAYFDYDADSPSCTLGVILNLMLVQEGLRPSFCVQEADRNASNDFVYDRALSFAERHMAVVDIVGEGRRRYTPRRGGGRYCGRGW